MRPYVRLLLALVCRYERGCSCHREAAERCFAAMRAVLASHCADNTSTDREDPESRLSSSAAALGVRERCAEAAAALFRGNARRTGFALR